MLPTGNTRDFCGQRGVTDEAIRREQQSGIGVFLRVTILPNRRTSKSAVANSITAGPEQWIVCCGWDRERAEKSFPQTTK